MTRIRTSLFTLGLIAFAASCGGPVHQARSRRPANVILSGSTGGLGYAPGLVVVDGIPPQPIYEVVPAQPYNGAYWVSGYWDWDGYSWVWIPGHYEVAPAGFVWIGPNYSSYGSYCEYTPGYWQPEGEEPARPVPTNSGVSTVPRRPAPPRAQVQEPRTPAVRPSYAPQPVDRLQPEVSTVPSNTVRVSPSVVAPSRPRVRPNPVRDFDQAPAPRHVVPQQARPVARPELTPRATPAPSLSPSLRTPTYNPAPAASSLRPTIRPSTPAFTPAPRVQSFTPAADNKPKTKQQTPVYTPVPLKSSAPKPSKK